MEYAEVLAALRELSDAGFKEFSAKIVNTRLYMYGVRTPALRALAKRLKKEYPTFAADFFAREDYSFEEVMLCGWQLGKDCAANSELLAKLIPRMDSWAHTDQIIDKFPWVRDPAAFLDAFAYLKNGGQYEARAYVMLLFNLCVREDRLPVIFRELPSVPLGRHYYVDMAVAWLICEVIVKYYGEGARLLREPYLTPWVVRKAVSKCRDSYRLTAEQKDELRAFAAQFPNTKPAPTE